MFSSFRPFPLHTLLWWGWTHLDGSSDGGDAAAPVVSPDLCAHRHFTALLKVNTKPSVKRCVFHGLYSSTVNVPAQQEFAEPPLILPVCLDRLRSAVRRCVFRTYWGGLQWRNSLLCVHAWEKKQLQLVYCCLIMAFLFLILRWCDYFPCSLQRCQGLLLCAYGAFL